MDRLTAAHAAGAAARDSYGRLLALLAASTGDLAAAEDALADAFERALRNWPEHGVPDSPDGWLLTVARNRLRDYWKSAQVQRSVPLDERVAGPAQFEVIDVDAIPDRRLELMLVCAHPAIERTAHTPLMLSTVLGFTAEQVGRAGGFSSRRRSRRCTAPGGMARRRTGRPCSNCTGCWMKPRRRSAAAWPWPP